ncbi:MAG: hypothetical protein NVS9B11_21800 [Candidatus Dormibacteraceae bacterium]
MAGVLRVGLVIRAVVAAILQGGPRFHLGYRFVCGWRPLQGTVGILLVVSWTEEILYEADGEPKFPVMKAGRQQLSGSARRAIRSAPGVSLKSNQTTAASM